MAPDSPDQPEKLQKLSPDDVLPPVEPPNVAFLMQLFLIPLMIVSLIVGGWLLFSWLASSSADPDKILLEIRRKKDTSWQQAVTLASMLDNPDARYAALRRDPAFARQLAEILRDEMKEPLTDRKQDDQRLKVCYFMCRALGCLETEDAIEPLLEAARTERNVVEVEIRLGAVEGLALLASRLGPEVLQQHDRALDVLLECSRTSDESVVVIEGKSSDYKPHGELRGTAAYALGVIGGPRALDRLAVMLDDPYPSARYNAATGLARQGDERAVSVLAEMLDPTNDLVAKDEKYESNRDTRRIQVLENGMKAARQLAEKSPGAAIDPLKKSLQVGATEGFTNIENQTARHALQLRARETLQRLK